MPYSQENRIHTRVKMYDGQAYKRVCSSHRVDFVCIGAHCLCIMLNFGYTHATTEHLPCAKKRQNALYVNDVRCSHTVVTRFTNVSIF